MVEKVGVDIILMGDSIGMNVFGYDTTLQMTMDLMVPHEFYVPKHLAKKKTEIDYINGALVREGEVLGMEVPLNRLITELIKGLEAIHSIRAD